MYMPQFRPETVPTPPACSILLDFAILAAFSMKSRSRHPKILSRARKHHQMLTTAVVIV